MKLQPAIQQLTFCPTLSMTQPFNGHTKIVVHRFAHFSGVLYPMVPLQTRLLLP